MPESDCPPSFSTSPRRRNGLRQRRVFARTRETDRRPNESAITVVAQNNENLLVDTATLTARLCAFA